MRRLLLALLVGTALATFADENPPRLERGHQSAGRHFLITAEHTLRANEQAELAAEGVEIQQTLPDRRYVVRAASSDVIAANPHIASVTSLTSSEKIDRSAYREAAHARTFARIGVVFHSDIAFADARAAVERIGGTVEDPLASDYGLPQRLRATIPFGSLNDLAADDRVFVVYGPPRKVAPMNANAALLSHVTPLYSAPYNLSGAGVVLSEFEFAKADDAHPEFGGRLQVHVSTIDSDNALHATHVAGTMIASGIKPEAKGMAPSATLHEFDAGLSYPDLMLKQKQDQLTPLGVVADNNSWGFPLSWQFTDVGWVWFGGEELYGVYDSQYSTPYDALAKTSSILFVQSAGNDGDRGNPQLPRPYFNHLHTDDEGNIKEGAVYCYSPSGTGTDCGSPCSVGKDTAGQPYCEVTKHPTHSAYNTLGPTSVLKNVISVGATFPDGTIASFSSRGPTGDGRVKPEIVAKGYQQYSTIPGGGYQNDQGTSMSAPVITGISALLTEQWRKSFNGQNPSALTLKTLLIAGADDLGAIGPDYTYGYGLANAQASVDLIIADNNTGSRIRTATIAQGQQIDTPLTVTSTQNVRIVIGWVDPEVLLSGTDASAKTLVNDLDLKVIDPAGNQVLPYVLDKNAPGLNATRGVNSVDNVEEVEIGSAAPGMYRVIVSGTNVATGPSLQFALVANAPLGSGAVACNDPFEPNDTEAGAFGNLVNREPIAAALCSATDVDYYRIRTTAAGPLSVSVTATDTPLRVTLSGNGITPVVRDIATGATGTVSTQTGSTTALYIVKIEPAGTLGATRAYTLVPAFATTPVLRRRATRH